MKDFQDRVSNWAIECFGEDTLNNQMERNQRFLEEALELVQCLSTSREQAHLLVDYVYDRPEGEPFQEVGGVMCTLSALCQCANIDMVQAAETELSRILSRMDEIRSKHLSKPRLVSEFASNSG